MPGETRQIGSGHREGLLRILSAGAFLVFFQSYLVAPLIPALAAEFHASTSLLGLLVPAYLLPYGFSTLVYGPVSDRLGREPVIPTLLGLLVVTTAGVATAQSAGQMLLWRVAGGVATGGIVPIGLALLGDIFPYNERGRPLGWMFGSVAGGTAFGSTLGALLNPVIGWRIEFLITAGVAAIVFGFGICLRRDLAGTRSDHPLSPGAVARGYLNLYSDPRAARAYFYIFLNGMFHSGVFSWLGLYFFDRYRLGDEGIGLALLGYGLPGMLLGPLIGRWADRAGRKRLIPAGILLAAASAAALIPAAPVIWPAFAAAFLSLGFDMSHPLLAGIITSVSPARRGLAMGMNAFVLFIGFGLGTLAFQALLQFGFSGALAVFGLIQGCSGLAAFRLFRSENPSGPGLVGENQR